jgi:hypothetical protein
MVAPFLLALDHARRAPSPCDGVASRRTRSTAKKGGHSQVVIRALARRRFRCRRGCGESPRKSALGRTENDSTSRCLPLLPQRADVSLARSKNIARIECYGTSVAPYTTDLRNNGLLSEPIVHAIVHRIGSRNLFRVPLHCSNDSPDRLFRTIIVAANVAAHSDR